jgi:hypothetical protein
LTAAKEYIVGTLHRVKEEHPEVGFLEGNPGVWAIASVIFDSLSWTDMSAYYLNKVRAVVKSRPFSEQVDFDRGLAGLLYTIEFLEGYYGNRLFERGDVIAIG